MLLSFDARWLNQAAGGCGVIALQVVEEYSVNTVVHVYIQWQNNHSLCLCEFVHCQKTVFALLKSEWQQT